MKLIPDPIIRIFPVIYILLLFLAGCRQPETNKLPEDFSRNQLIKWNQALTQVIITDVLTPPVCSRVYAYSNIAAYEALRQEHSAHISYAKKLNGLAEINKPEGDNKQYNFSIASIIAFSTVAQKMVFNSDAILTIESKYLEEIHSFNLDEKLEKRSIEYGRQVGRQIIAWASKDGYLQRNSIPAYIVTREPGRWVPTPPDYMDAVEPNWNTLRPFTLDSASQFRPDSPPSFDTTPGSAYYKQLMQVYDAVNKTKPNLTDIAKFWDCNPNISVTQGHVTYFQQKISPAGHWIHVAGSICNKEKFDDMKTAEIISKVAISIADGFISCWEAKYHYNTIRPETVINRYVDKDWKPLLQTPPFPEYPSGHSVVSGAASAILTALVKDHYSYTDSTELPFGMFPRSFSSFNEAASEASISRLYGGIHFMPALNNGLEEGRKISRHVVEKLH
jgi:PAP2 superfamily